MLRLGLAGVALAALILPATAQTHVQGYYRSNGTYVQPHVRSAPNSSTYDNYSTQGNVNPYTGSYGTVNPSNSYGSYGSSNSGGHRKNMFGN